MCDTKEKNWMEQMLEEAKKDPLDQVAVQIIFKRRKGFKTVDGRTNSEYNVHEPQYCNGKKINKPN